MFAVHTNCAYNGGHEFRVGPAKAATNYRKHGVRFAEALSVFTDDLALTVENGSADGEQCFIAMGAGLPGRVIVVAFCYRDENIRLISARLAEPRERHQYEDKR